MPRIWVSRANDRKNTLICAAETFEEVQKAGRAHWEKTGKTHYLREYLDLESVEYLLEKSVEARQSLDLIIDRIAKKQKMRMREKGD